MGHYEHFERLKAYYLGLRSFAGRDRALIAQHVREQVRAGARLHELLPSTEQRLRTHGIVLPGVTVLQKLIGTARMAAEDEVFVALSGRVNEATKERILAPVQVPPGQRLTPFQQLQRAAGRPSPEAFTQEVELLTQVHEFLPANLDLSDLAPSLLERLASLISGLPPQALLRFHAPKRLGLLLCWLWRLRTHLVETALTISNELVAGVLRRAKSVSETRRAHVLARSRRRQSNLFSGQRLLRSARNDLVHGGCSHALSTPRPKNTTGNKSGCAPCVAGAQ